MKRSSSRPPCGRSFLLALLAPCAAGGLAPPGAAQTCVVEHARLLDATPMAGDEVGRAVALAPGMVLVGHPLDDQGGTDAGSVLVFGDVGGAWTLQAVLRLSPGHAGDTFGGALAADGARVAVGAERGDQGGVNAGAAYVLQNAGGAWTLEDQLVADDALPYDFLGGAVDLSGTRAIAGARFADPAGMDSGAAYVFVQGTFDWSQEAKLVAADAAPLDRFGTSVGLDGDLAAVGAPDADGPGTDSGSVYVFERQAGVWTQTAVLAAADGAAGDRLGTALAVDGQRIVAAKDGARGVYVFERAGASWQQVQKLVAPEAGPSGFGASVALRGALLLVGDDERDSGAVHNGRAYLFEHTGGSFAPAAVLRPSATFANQRFGFAVALEDGRAAVGAPHVLTSNMSPGSAYAFAVGAPLGVPHCASTPNSTGAPAEISAVGCNSVHQDDLVLSAAPVPDQLGLFFYGPNAVQFPFGNGFRCVGGGTFRLPIVAASGGVLSAALDYAAPTLPGFELAPGSTFSFQAWFRDPAAGGALFDLSDALRITFYP